MLERFKFDVYDPNLEMLDKFTSCHRSEKLKAVENNKCN
jgi:hypothetical protein